MFQNDEEYYSDREYLSNSSMGILMESLDKFYLWKNRLWEQKDIPAYYFGRAVHSYFLEGIDLAVEYPDRRYGAAYNEFAKLNEGKIILTSKEYENYCAVRERLDYCQELIGLIDRSIFKAEVPAVGHSFGVPVKAKADGILDDGFSRVIIDLKTTSSSVADFHKKAREYDYDRQAALYKHLFGGDRFIFVVVTKEHPVEIGIFECSDEFIDRGVGKLIEATSLYKHCFMDGEYKFGSVYRSTL